MSLIHLTCSRVFILKCNATSPLGSGNKTVMLWIKTSDMRNSKSQLMLVLLRWVRVIYQYEGRWLQYIALFHSGRLGFTQFLGFPSGGSTWFLVPTWPDFQVTPGNLKMWHQQTPCHWLASQLRYLKSHASVSFTKIKNAILSILRKSHTPGSRSTIHCWWSVHVTYKWRHGTTLLWVIYVKVLDGVSHAGQEVIMTIP